MGLCRRGVLPPCEGWRDGGVFWGFADFCLLAGGGLPVFVLKRERKEHGQSISQSNKHQTTTDTHKQTNKQTNTHTHTRAHNLTQKHAKAHTGQPRYCGVEFLNPRHDETGLQTPVPTTMPIFVCARRLHIP
jgi:hypothetical protein